MPSEGPSQYTSDPGVVFWLDYSVLEARLGALNKEVFPYIKKTWEEIAKWAYEEVKLYTPPTKTGTDLRSMWMLEEQGDLFASVNGIAEWLIYNTYPDARVIGFFEYGTKPHEIPVGPCGFLHFFTYEGEEVYTKKSVWHPGTPAYRMVDQTVKETQVKIDQYMAATFQMVDQMLAAAADAAESSKGNT